jgi:uncharacterized protein YjdB
MSITFSVGGLAGIFEEFVKSITINPTDEIELYINNTKTFNALISNSSATNKKYYWITTTPKLIKLDIDSSNNCTVTAIKDGTATIVVVPADGSNAISIKNIKVKPILVETIAINPSTQQYLNVGQNIAFTYSVTPLNATYQSVLWSASNSNGSISTAGVFKAISNGDVVVTVKTTDDTVIKTATCPINITTKATGISIGSNSYTVLSGDAMQLSKTIYPSTTSNQSVSWSTSNSNVATVDGNGRVECYYPGSTTISVRTLDGSNLQSNSNVNVSQRVFSYGGNIGVWSRRYTQGNKWQTMLEFNVPIAYSYTVSWSYQYANDEPTYYGLFVNNNQFAATDSSWDDDMPTWTWASSATYTTGYRGLYTSSTIPWQVKWYIHDGPDSCVFYNAYVTFYANYAK